MNYYLILLLSFFAFSLNCMEEKNPQKSWTPWDTSRPTIMEHYLTKQVARAVQIKKPAQILSKVSAKYEKIRIGAHEGVPKYTKEYFESINKKYESFLKQVIEIDGWPTEEKLNAECALGASLIAQHSYNLKFQEMCLPYLAQLNSISGKQQHAYLSDLIHVKKGQPQHFGTQVDLQGKLYPILGYTPNSDNFAETELQLERVNKRRESVGFLSLQDEHARSSQFIMRQQMPTNSHDPQPTESTQ